MKGLRKLTTPGSTNPKSQFELFLSEYSELLYIYAAIPAFALTFLGIITGILLFAHKSEYDQCKSSTDRLFALFLGQLIFYYTFIILYSNLLFQIIPALNTLTVTLFLFVSYFISNTGWNLWGIKVLSTTGCSSSVYAGMASFTVAFVLFLDLILLLGFVMMWVKKRKGVEIKQTPQVLSDSKFVEQPSALEDNLDIQNNPRPNTNGKAIQEENQDNWKEENLDDF